MTDIHLEACYNVTVLGIDGVGKSSFIIQFIQNRFINSHDSSIEEFYEKKIEVDNEVADIANFDTSYQKGPSDTKTDFMKNSQCFIILYSIDDKSSFESIEEFANEIQICKPNVFLPVIVCANKIDVADRKITEFEAIDYCSHKGFIHFEVSAKTNNNIQNVFIESVKMMRDISTSFFVFYSISTKKNFFNAILNQTLFMLF